MRVTKPHYGQRSLADNNGNQFSIRGFHIKWFELYFLTKAPVLTKMRYLLHALYECRNYFTNIKGLLNYYHLIINLSKRDGKKSPRT